MTYEFRCPKSTERFTLTLNPNKDDLNRQPCAGCSPECPVRWIKENNRVFSPFNINMGPEPYRPGTPNKYTDEIHPTMRDYEKHLDDNQLELRRD